MAHRAVFEVELSFENLKFFVVIRRKIFNKVIDTDGVLSEQEKKEIKKEIRKSKKREYASGGPNKISPSPNEQVLPGGIKLFVKVMWVTQAKQLLRLFNGDLK